ncbi:SIR2 family protein [Paludibaculum fermentans]|uniref:SIR2 family protein n=1 Tax=Paludibaculum fermentans TaxID=1473598 RepID=UPI003EBD1188
MNIEEALEFVLAGRALLFTGAGFSRGAVNLRGTPFKAGTAFAAHLAKLADLPETTSLEDAAEWFTEKHGKSRMVEELQQEFTVKQVSQGQIDILHYPWKRIYTTNYDNVAETAAAQNGQKLAPATLVDRIHALPKTGTLCVHLNGFIDRLKVPSLDSEIKLTDTSYLTNIVAESPWAVTLRQDMDAARAIFFIGYSTADIDIRRLLYDRPELKDKSFFVIGPQTDPVAVQKISRFGTITGLDLAGLVSALAIAAKSHSEDTDQTPINYCVRPYEPPNNPPTFEDRLIFDLFLHGDIRPDYAWQSLHGEIDYFVDSPAAVTALSCFDSGHRAVAIYSDLGNGKTAVLEVLKTKAYDAGYDVYSIVHNADSLLEELEAIFRSTRKTLLTIEQYADWLDTVAFIGTHAPKNCVLALSARSSTHDLLVDRLGELLKPGTIAEIPVDRLQPQQCERIAGLFDRYGLWGDLAAKSKTFKLRHLEERCHGAWHAILIDRFNAPQVHERFSPIIEALSKKKRFYEVVTAVLILNVLEYSPSVDLLLDLCGPGVLEKEFKDDASVREVLDASSGRIRLRSSVAGQYILTNFADPNGLVAVLTKMAKAADANARNSRLHFELLKDLTKFNGLQYVFPEKDRRKACIRYYESIKDLHNTRNNPLFWLQYAIACTLFEEFDRAEKYFGTAYALAEARDFNSFQIDNHYARFLLMRSISTKEESTCMKNFRDARKLIFEQVVTERRHYPFRVATHLAEFFDTFVAVLSPTHQQEIARAAKHILGRIEALPKERQDQRYVTDCRKAMLHVLELAAAV